MRFRHSGAAKAAGMVYATHVLNQPNKEDNGWHYFATRSEIETFLTENTDPFNQPFIDRLA